MPIPTSEQYRYEEGRIDGEAEGRTRGRVEGRAEGRADGAARMIATARRDRFGADERIEAVAGKLAAEPETWFSRVLAAGSLDELD